MTRAITYTTPRDVTLGGGVLALLAGIFCTTWPDGVAEHVLFWLRWWVLMLLALGCATWLTWKILSALTAADAA
jgi:hypothetical protein